jgi:hypothetical protein
MTPSAPAFEHRSLLELSIDDERTFGHVRLYGRLKELLIASNYRFRLLPAPFVDRDDHALLLNLTYWSASEGGDVLAGPRLAADVVAHTAWHHLTALRLATSEGAAARPSTDALLLGESIASAFDVYLVGCLLGHAPRSEFLTSQVSAMAEVTYAAGLPKRGFQRLLESLAADPEGAFGALRALLFDVQRALLAAEDATAALAALAAYDGHRFAPLLHRYELSNWVLHARIHGRPAPPNSAALAVDQSLRQEPAALAWLERHWLLPTLAAG